MARLLFGLGVAAVIFTIYAVADCAFFDRSRIRGLGRGWWIVIILFVPIIGGGEVTGIALIENLERGTRSAMPMSACCPRWPAA